MRDETPASFQRQAGAGEELREIINALPGVVILEQTGGVLRPVFLSDGVPELTGRTREEYEKLAVPDVFLTVYEQDRERVRTAVYAALQSGGLLDVSYRVHHRDGHLIWLHLSGRRMESSEDSPRLCAVLKGMSAETRLFQSMADESVDGIYVIDCENYDLLYANESIHLFMEGENCVGQKCYAALHGRTAPCEFCTLKTREPDGVPHEMLIPGSNRVYSTRFRRSDWNGIPAYIKYVKDMTDVVNARREKEQLEQYYQSVLENLAGGVAVVRRQADGNLYPEYLSEGFAAMTHMSMEEAWELYRADATAGIHPEDRPEFLRRFQKYIDSNERHYVMTYRVRRGDGGYVWVKNTFTRLRGKNGADRLYTVFNDVTREMEEQEQLRRQYRELLVQHYRSPESNAIIVGHCNITKNRILEIKDRTGSDLIARFGGERESFFRGLSTLVVEERERQTFLETFLNAPMCAAFERGRTELRQRCFVKLPNEQTGRHVRIKVNLVETPDTGDVTGILTVGDVTDETISERIMQQLSSSGYEFVADVDLLHDTASLIVNDEHADNLPPHRGSHSQRILEMQNSVVPRDRQNFVEMLAPDYMLSRLKREGRYSFPFSIEESRGDIRTKNMNVSAVDLRLGRICLARTDITDSVREQQGLLNMIAYTFDMAGFIDVATRRLTLYTRQTVLENLRPYIIEQYDGAVERFAECYGAEEDCPQARQEFQLKTMLAKLEQRPGGYDFVLPYHSEEEMRYKQINVLWGDANHRTVCLVRADVTDMLTAERQRKRDLELALSVANEASRAKSEFLSAMSHDIRTPMNAIMGMTMLACANLEDRARVEDCLKKISVSSKHLLSLINDVLDMSKIESAKVTLDRGEISLSELLEQLTAIMTPQARAAGLQLEVRTQGISHGRFFSDALRIKQILINILGNAVKFTPAPGSVTLTVEELEGLRGPDWARYRFTVADTGVGMTQEFAEHIFEPFTRSSREFVSRVEGTGLGMSITKGLVDLLGGTVEVESQVGEGSTFRVTLEVELAQESGEIPPAESAVELGEVLSGRHFLVVEDNEINAEILCELLRMNHAQTTLARDGLQAVRTFQNTAPGTFDAILMDIQMPQMDGYEAARAIRASQPAQTGRIPIIAMTANAFAEDVQAALGAGMDAHVAKPIDFERLKAALAKLL